MVPVIDQYKKQIANCGAEEILAFFSGEFPGKCIFSSSLGAEDQVLTDMIAKTRTDIRIFTLDTGRLFRETYDLIHITEQKYHRKIEVFFPDASSVENMVNAKGINLFYESPANRKECCNIRKIEPLKRALRDMKVWITGLRRDQSVSRSDSVLVNWDDAYSVIKVNPLVDWTEAAVWAYIRSHKVPYNTLHDKGFPSIGCLPCTRAVLPGEDGRAGRWWWENESSRECGLHTKENEQTIFL
jgi:phosphoadenosine phosphosulfate reductase